MTLFRYATTTTTQTKMITRCDDRPTTAIHTSQLRLTHWTEIALVAGAAAGDTQTTTVGAASAYHTLLTHTLH